MEQIVQVLTWDDCAMYGQLSSSGIRGRQGCESTHSPRGHEGLLYAGLGDGPGQRILKAHGDSQQVADCLTKIMTLGQLIANLSDFDRCSNLSMRELVQEVVGTT